MNAEFEAQTRSACEHLYDLSYLRTHALLAHLPASPQADINAQAWRLHYLLIEAIRQLDPGPNAPVFSREWRRQRLLERRYVDGIDPAQLAAELNISRRQYYRDLNQALAALAETLSVLLGVRPGPKPAADAPPAAEPALHEMRCTLNLLETAQGALHVLAQIFEQQGLSVRLEIPPETPAVAASASLLRQVLLSMLGYLAGQASQAEISLRARIAPESVQLELGLGSEIPLAAPAERPWEEMAELEGLQIRFDPLHPQAAFALTLPLAGIRRVLAVDDNTDILQLYQRFLSSHDYQLIAESDPSQALELAGRLKPDLILLDLMMPGADGWDVLQSLAHTPETSAIPVIVCSILPQRELAHSLGAAAFLQKPISEKALIETIRSLSC